MSREFPDWVNPWKAAEGKRIFSGSVALGRMPRLKPLLAAADGEARFTASFVLDGEKRATIALAVSAELPLTCQASLEAFMLPVERKSRLAVIEDQAEEENLPEHYDPVIARSGKIVFADLVEDELLLAMPQVPRKPGLQGVRFSTDPQAAEAAESPEHYHRPFAALRSMLGDGRRDRDTDSD